MGNKHSSEDCQPTEVNANTQAVATQGQKTLYAPYSPTPIAEFNTPAMTPEAQRRAIPFGASHPEPMAVYQPTVLSKDNPVPNGADARVDYIQVDMTN